MAMGLSGEGVMDATSMHCLPSPLLASDARLSLGVAEFWRLVTCCRARHSLAFLQHRDSRFVVAARLPYVQKTPTLLQIYPLFIFLTTTKL